MPFPILLAVLAGFAFAAVVVLVFLNWNRIVNWFRNRQSLKHSDRANIAFTLKDSLDNGKYSVIQGIFNTRTNEVLDGAKYEAEDVGDELKYNEPLTIIQ